MPHLRLEYTAPLPPEIAGRRLLKTLHGILHEVLGVRRQNCKSRVVPLDIAAVGDGAGDQTFVHLEVTFLAGRSAPARRELGERLLRTLVDAYADCGHQPQITVSVGEFRRSEYFKHPSGTLTPHGG